MRHRHFLKPNHRSSYPSQCVWLDCEANRHGVGTPEEHHTLAFGHACYRYRVRGDHWQAAEWLRFEEPAELWTWVEARTRKRRTLHIWAHNMGYDGTIAQAWTTLPRLGWKLIGAVIDSPPFFVRLRKGTSTIVLADTLNLWTVKLAVIGEIVGLPKLDMPSDTASTETWDQYCKRDVEIIEVMCRRWWSWLREQDMGQARLTLASQALTCFRHRHMKDRLLVHDNAEANELARTAYHGGRCEAWTLGELPGPTELWDVTSLYPSVMRSETYPTRLIGVYQGVSLEDLDRALDRWCVIAEVEVETDLPIWAYGAAERLTFPVGRFVCTLTTPELRSALEANSVRSVGRVAVYHKAPIFAGYIDHLWGLRADAKQRGDRFMDHAAKLLMNSLYGKFGQLGIEEEIISENAPIEPKVWTEIDAETGRAYRMRQFMGQVVSTWREGEAPNSMPEIAAHVTAYGRMLLWHEIMAVGPEHVHYMDTDSLLIDRGAPRPGPISADGRMLGAWALQAEYATGAIHGPKDYRLGDRTKVKGVRSNATWLDPARVEQETWLGLRSLIELGDVDHPRIRRTEKRLQRVYRKGCKLPSGRVRPWRLPDESGRLLA